MTVKRKLKSLSYLSRCDLCEREASDYAVTASAAEEGKAGFHISLCFPCPRLATIVLLTHAAMPLALRNPDQGEDVSDFFTSTWRYVGPPGAHPSTLERRTKYRGSRKARSATRRLGRGVAMSCNMTISVESFVVAGLIGMGKAIAARATPEPSKAEGGTE